MTNLKTLKALKPVAFAIGNWQIILAVGGALALSHALVGWHFYGVGKEVQASAQHSAAAKAAEVAEKSAGVAAGEREADTDDIANDKDKADAAIEATKSQNVSPTLASDALNCERLRRGGQDINRFPACAGRETTGGTTAQY